MSSPVRFFVVAIALFLAACGFTPMYGSSAKNGSVTANFSNVEIAMIPDQSGIYLRNILIDNFYQDGYPSSPAYILNVGPIVESERDLDITLQSEATRQQIRLVAPMTLTDKKTGEVVLTRSLSAITSHNILDSQFTTRISEADAREAALADLARQVESQVALYLNR